MDREMKMRNPIVEASVDMRCNYNMPSEAIVGIIYSILVKNNFSNLQVQTLPIFEIPEPIRNSDPNLKNSPTHKISTGNPPIQRKVA